MSADNNNCMFMFVSRSTDLRMTMLLIRLPSTIVLLLLRTSSVSTVICLEEAMHFLT